MHFKEIIQKIMDFTESDLMTQLIAENVKDLKDVDSAKQEAKNLIDEIAETLPGGDNIKRANMHEVLEFLKKKQSGIKDYHEMMKS